VATMGASNYTYAEAVASEGLEDWILAHVRMFAFLGGVPKAIVPDNLKSAVIKADSNRPIVTACRAGRLWRKARA
jgi:transposase